MSWINYLPPACWSTFWKSIFKQQLGSGFDIMDSISFFCILTYANIYVLIHHIIFWLYLYFLNILNFFKYSCTNIFHRRSLCTFYLNQWRLVHWRIYVSLGLIELSRVFFDIRLGSFEDWNDYVVFNFVISLHEQIIISWYVAITRFLSYFI